MLGSRFWYLLLAAAGASALAAAFLGQAAFNRQYDVQLNDQLRRDRFEIELMLRMDARTRIDAIGALAAQGDVRTALQQASGRRNRNQVSAERRNALGQKLSQLNGQLEGMAADILFAVDNRGYIIAQLGPGEIPAGAGLGAFPLVERALAGYVRDDVWVYNDVVYRMAARPVIDRGIYVGAIVHGMRMNDELARRLSERLSDATVAFFRGDEVVGSHMPAVEGAAQGAEIAGGLGDALQDERLREGHRTDPVDLNGGASRGVYSLVTGSAHHVDVGYAIARPRSVLASPFDIFEEVADDDVAALPWPIIGGFGLVGFIFGMFFLWLERDRPVGKLRRAATAFEEGKLQRFDLGSHGGAYRKIAQSLNAGIEQAIEAAGASGPARKPANLDEILGPSPEAPEGNAFFGFAEGQADGSIPPAPGTAAAPADAPRPPVAPAVPAAPPAPPVAPPPPAPAAAPQPAPPAPAAAPQPAPPAPVAAPQPAPVAAQPAQPAPPAPTPAPPGKSTGKPDWAKGTLMGTGVEEAGAGAGPIQAPILPPEDDEDEDDDVSTMVAQVPEELLNAIGSNEDEEDRHFREVFDKFLDTKKTCGEPTAGLTYDKFSGTLRKNRDQIVARHGAARVRFTVYVKAGKAALKATPVK